jgi:hypothetical protein
MVGSGDVAGEIALNSHDNQSDNRSVILHICYVFTLKKRRSN